MPSFRLEAGPLNKPIHEISHKTSPFRVSWWTAFTGKAVSQL